jgi:hypothetical protein
VALDLRTELARLGSLSGKGLPGTVTLGVDGNASRSPTRG